MGMTIERIIEIYNEFDRIGGTLIRGNSEEDTKYNSETIEALQSINVILHKYQKIVNIVSLNDEEFKQCGLKELKEILEVIADGRN